MSGPLAGIRVLDLGSMVAAPYGAAMLGDMGADVIKIEPPVGDELRQVGPGIGNDSGLFVGANRNKRGLVLDLRSAAGRAVFGRLAATSDIVIHNLRPQAQARVGLRYEDLINHRPDIISVTVSTYGESGPYAGRPGIDPSAQALSGFMTLTGFPGSGPLRTSVPIADATAANLVAFGAMTALWARAKDGQGQAVDVSLIDAMVHLQPGPIGQYGLVGYVQPQVGNGSPFFAPYNTYRCRDGRLIHVATINDKFFVKLYEALGAPELGRDARFLTNELRLANTRALDEALQAIFDRHDSGEMMRRMQAADAIAAPVKDIVEMFTDPQVLNNRMLVPVAHRLHGDLRVGGVPVKLKRTPGGTHRAPPTLGEHSREILQELGFANAEVAQLLAPGGGAAIAS